MDEIIRVSCEILRKMKCVSLIDVELVQKNVVRSLNESGYTIANLMESILRMFCWSPKTLFRNLRNFESFVKNDKPEYWEKWVVHMAAASASFPSIFDRETWEDTSVEDLDIDDAKTEIVILREVLHVHCSTSTRYPRKN